MPNKLLFLAALMTLTLSASSQYYYKDLVSTQQINNTYRLLRQNKIKLVKLKSYQGAVPIEEGFICEQRVNLARNEVVTYTKTANSPETFFTAIYNAQGSLVRTTDSTAEAVSTTRFTYNNAGKLELLNTETHATDKSSVSSESHRWEYRNNQPYRMFRTKNDVDTASFYFTVDQKGNLSEEEQKTGKFLSRKMFYYYDEKNRLTDIVQYSPLAKRLLPNYVFEYEDNGELSTMTVVPEGSNDYQKWYYKYDEGGLRLVEFCYDRKNELLGKIEYDYQFAK
ncbi:MAG: hypothetical protein ABI151_16545 [Chitinophagaceae bacterium]